MNHYSPIINITHSLINEDIRVLYFKHSSFFDLLINEIDAVFCNYNDVVKEYYYDMSFSNNLLSYENDVRVTSMVGHIKSLVGIHSGPPPKFKKEDLFLVANNTKRINKIFFGEDMVKKWRTNIGDKASIINYGIPECSFTEQRDNDILVINLENNPQIDLLYSTISKQFPSANILKNLDSTINIEILSKYLNSYKICIDPLHKINTLFTAACGCVTLTSTDIVSDQNELIVPIENYGMINNILEMLLLNSLSEEKRQNSARMLTRSYNYDDFKNNLLQTLNNIKHNEIFLP